MPSGNSFLFQEPRAPCEYSQPREGAQNAEALLFDVIGNCAWGNSPCCYPLYSSLGKGVSRMGLRRGQTLKEPSLVHGRGGHHVGKGWSPLRNGPGLVEKDRL